MWGQNTVGRVDPFVANAGNAFERLIDYMVQVDADCQRQGYSLPYTLTRRCTGVMLPHKTSDPLRRMRPFKSLPEQWAKYSGGRAVSLLSDPDFMDFPEL
jgi:hypothetical protein